MSDQPPVLKVLTAGQTASAHLLLGKSLFLAGRYGPALKELNAALEENPELALAHYLTGLIRLIRADFANAAIAIETATRLGGGDEHLADYWITLAHVRLELGVPEAALSAVDSGLGVDPELANGHLVRGDVLGILDRRGEAVVAYRQAVRLNPQLTKARFKLGRLLLEEGDVDEAVRQTILARRLDPTNPETRVSLANLLRKLGRHDEAIGEYKAAIEVSSPLGQALPLAKLGETYLELGRVPEAVSALHSALKRDPKNVWAYLTLGRIYFDQQHYEEAVELLQAAVELDSRLPEALDLLVRAQEASLQKTTKEGMQEAQKNE
jgi:tetratricopeptide (TPR) repeat protein